MTLRTARLSLRPPTMADLLSLHEIHADPETSRFNPSGPSPDLAASREMVAGWLADWREHGVGYWAVRLTGTPEVIGVGGLRVTELEGEPVSNLYYCFRPSAWGQGYATELASTAIEYGTASRNGTPSRSGGALLPWRRKTVRSKPLPPVVALIRPGNVASQKVAERAGLRWNITLEHRGHPMEVYR